MSLYKKEYSSPAVSYVQEYGNMLLYFDILVSFGLLMVLIIQLFIETGWYH